MENEQILNPSQEEENGGTVDTEDETVETTVEEEDKSGETNDNPQPNAEEDVKSFTQEQVNGMIKGRVDKIYNRYGVKGSKELDELVGKSKSYDVIKSQYGDLQVKYADLQKQMSFMKNNIDEARIDDVNTYFKGKNLDFSDENLVKELETHPEWVKQAPQPQVQVLGPSRQEAKHSESAEEKMNRIFGIK